MVKGSYNDYTEAQPTSKPVPTSKPIGGIRIARVEYDFEEISASNNDREGLSIGQMIDKKLSDASKNGTMISEVSLFFETKESQAELLELYRNKY